MSLSHNNEIMIVVLYDMIRTDISTLVLSSRTQHASFSIVSNKISFLTLDNVRRCFKGKPPPSSMHFPSDSTYCFRS